MKILFPVVWLCVSVSQVRSGVIVHDDGTAVLENRFLSRKFEIGNILRTVSITNKLDGNTLAPGESNEFVIQTSDGTPLASGDFAVKDCRTSNESDASALEVVLASEKVPLRVTVEYSLGKNDFFARKQLRVTPLKEITIKKIDIESLSLDEAWQPYTIRQITAQGAARWRPGLGQPLYTKKSGTFWGVESPAGVNRVDARHLVCSQMVGKTLPADGTFVSSSSVMGVARSPDLVKDAFFDYIDLTRIRPLRLQTQYNCWFDFGSGVDAAKFVQSVGTIHRELNEVRKVPPLRAYVIDDGWQDTRADWSKSGVWPVNGKFDSGFKRCVGQVRAAGSRLGLWLSPGCNFGGQAAIPSMKAAGYRALDPWMSMSDPAYMDKLEQRMVELTRLGVAYFKLDGVFGHLNQRNFDIPGFKGGERGLDDPRYDEAKIQYLTDGSERLNRIFSAMHRVNPDIYIVISNGAWLSPWWLQHVDGVWMINAGDSAAGSSRTRELVYRDGIYHDLAVMENTQFPLNSLFNHEPKKTSSRETKDEFRRYLYMSLSRGTGFIELYLKTGALKAYDWDVLAEGLEWVHGVFPAFKRSRMHGGSPRDGEVYGFTGWTPDQGYVSIHNPADKEQVYQFTLSGGFGLPPGCEGRVYHVSSPLESSLEGLPDRCREGDALEVRLRPREIRILNFDTGRRDWSGIRALQQRTTDDYQQPVELPVKGHAILGVWTYGPHRREFRQDGTCTLTSNGVVSWTRKFKVLSPSEAEVDGGLAHRIMPDGTLRIEDRYTAVRE